MNNAHFTKGCAFIALKDDKVGIKKLCTKTMAVKSLNINGNYSNLAYLIVTYFDVLSVNINKEYQIVCPLQPCLCR